VRGEVELAGDLHALRIGPAAVDATVAAYRADVRGMIVWAPNFRFEWSPTNVDVTRRGVDASARARFRPAELELRGAASRVAVHYATPALSGQVVYRPALTASGGASADLGDALRGVLGDPLGRALVGVRAELGARYMGARRTAPGSALNLLPAYAVTDLRVERRATRAGWDGTLSLGVDDLLDRQPATLVDFPSPGRVWRLALRVGRAGRGDADRSVP
jgi:hypothetical protein